ncbi:MAG: hypothetical protein AAGH15_07665 [Myxococcota bacterium]
MARHRFVQVFDARRDVARERFMRDRRDRGGRDVPAPTVRRRGARLRAAKAALGAVLRPLGLALFGGVIAYPALYFAVGAMAVACFTVHVALFFAVFDLWVLLGVMAFVAGRDRTVHAPFHEGAPNALGLDPTQLGVGAVSLVGTVARLGPSTGPTPGPVLVDAWGRAPVPRRVLETDDFVLTPADGSLPVVVRFEAAPLVLGRPERLRVETVPLSRPGRAELGGGEALIVEVREGDRLRLHASGLSDLPRLDHVELGGEIRRWAPRGADDADPYRGAGPGPGRLARSTAARPLLLTLLDERSE